MSWTLEGFGLDRACVIRGGAHLAPLLEEFCPGDGKVFVIMEERVASLHGDKFPSWGQRLLLPSLGDGLKQSHWLEKLLGYFYVARVNRCDWILVAGGGALLDLVGFAASVFKRGVNTVLVPTTLLAQVDAAIGGKCAINWRGTKNLLGSFHFPAQVFCAADVLTTLPRRQFFSGLGEVYKYQLLSQGKHFYPSKNMEEVVEQCCSCKNALVAQDPWDMGGRRLLNFGHTLAHALETAVDGLLHGEAVLWGLEYALRVAQGRGGISSQQLNSAVRELRTVPRPSLPRIDFVHLYQRMVMDKKNSGQVSMVLPGSRGFDVVNCTRKELEAQWLALNP